MFETKIMLMGKFHRPFSCQAVAAKSKKFIISIKILKTTELIDFYTLENLDLECLILRKFEAFFPNLTNYL